MLSVWNHPPYMLLFGIWKSCSSVSPENLSMRSVSHNGFFLFHASSVLVIKDNLDFTFAYLGVGQLFCLCVCVLVFSILSCKHSHITCWMVTGLRVIQTQQTQNAFQSLMELLHENIQRKKEGCNFLTSETPTHLQGLIFLVFCC